MPLFSARSAAMAAARPALMPSQRSGSNSQLGLWCWTKGSVVNSVCYVRSDHEVGECVRRDASHHHAISRVAPRTREATFVVHDHRGGLVAGHRERSAPAMGDRTFQGGKELAQVSLPGRRRPWEFWSISRLHGRTEVIRRAPTAEGEAIVAGALSVDDEVSGVVECLVLRESRFGPEVIALGLGGDHERIQRRHAASFAGQLGREAFGRSHHEARVHAAFCRDDLGLGVIRARQNLGHLGVLKDAHTELFVHVGQTAHETCGMHARTVRRVRGTQ